MERQIDCLEGIPAVTAATPDIDDFSRAYWDAAAGGVLLIRRCRGCGQPHHYPREFCPYCWGEDVEWERASGRATLYTWSVVHRNDLPPFGERVPYVAAVVDLVEGPRMMTEVVECAEGRLRIGMELTVTFRTEPSLTEPSLTEGDGGALAVPVFRPASPRS
ncbi:OB-fold domain-containing protein [Streptomyces sp. NPDC048057]|uniref:Zn-ribbon domain-containing OB-fold protein n=1 Tax=Streptomyces sp. NPDC048057 TaxID=3155628 RepID=UPI0033C095C7